MELAEAMQRGPVVLDGGLATQLEAAGHDLGDELWSARLLADDPEAIGEAHRAYVRAGASVITTASYQATIEGFARRGLPAETLLRRSVTLARDAGARWVAASIGPYGAALADGSEYRGNYGLSKAELVRFHRPRMRILAEAEPDVFAMETVPDIREAEAMLAALDGIGIPAWLSYTIEGDRTRAGQPLSEAFDVDGVIAVGVNCSSPADATRAISLVRGRPAVIYPNSGETWNATSRRWTGTGTHRFPVTEWLRSGARLIGGCCRVTPDDIAAIVAIAQESRAAPMKTARDGP